VVEKVLAERHSPAGVAAVAGEGAQRLAADGGRRGVDGGDRAARAGLGHGEGDVADGERLPAVLGVGLAAGDDEVRTEALHPHGRLAPLGELGVEEVDGGLRQQQERVGVGEQHPRAERRRRRRHARGLARDVPPGRVAEAHQAAPRPEQVAHELAGLASGHGRRHGVAPDGDARVRGTGVVREGHPGLAVAGGGEDQRVGRQRRVQERQARLLPLGDEPARVVDDHPAAVVPQSGRDDLGLRQRDAAGRLHGVDVEPGEPRLPA